PLHGKELSYNNVVDIDAALALAEEFRRGPEVAVAILKHNTPCGVGVGRDPLEAWERAYATDPESPFGGIVVSTHSWTLPLARAFGGGQPCGVEPVRNARARAERLGISLRGSVLASDAFFPFADGLEEAIAAGATAVIQPGGSTRDQEVIRAADAHGVAMIFTGVRHFRH